MGIPPFCPLSNFISATKKNVRKKVVPKLVTVNILILSNRRLSRRRWRPTVSIVQSLLGGASSSSGAQIHVPPVTVLFAQRVPMTKRSSHSNQTKIHHLYKNHRSKSIANHVIKQCLHWITARHMILSNLPLTLRTY